MPRLELTAAVRKKMREPAQAGNGAVAGGLAGVALASEFIPHANTALLLFALQRLTGARSMVDVLDLLVRVFGGLGWASYPAYAGLLVALQVVPLFSALLLIVLAGALYGPLWGTLLLCPQPRVHSTHPLVPPSALTCLSLSLSPCTPPSTHTHSRAQAWAAAR